MIAGKGRSFALAAVLALLATPVAFTARAQDSTAAAQRAAEGRIEPGDRVGVKVYLEPSLSDEVLVNSQGNIVLARIGSIHVASIAVGALQDTLRARYATFLRNPDVSVTVLRRVVVNGDVGRPNVYYVDVTSTLRDVIAQAGGITENGNPDKVAIIRNGESIPVPNWRDDVSRASDLRSGDQIFVPKRSWLYRNMFSIASTGVLISSFLYTVLHK
ncbi:MAG TPA: polysaccharide biosynthesis/export family protein [Gemmatimonadaceae bacterium]|nr:polysaccharide biosynthesis/export family protein [Gemmatimonadaceae bacterium]